MKQRGLNKGKGAGRIFQHEVPGKMSTSNVAMEKAYRSGAYSMAQTVEHFGVNYMTVSRTVRKFETASTKT